MTYRLTTTVAMLTLALSAAAGAQPVPGGGARLTLDDAVRLALQHNRQIDAARLQVLKADADLATARSRRLPTVETQVNASQLLTPLDVTFPAGAFGVYPGTGPIPAGDTTVRASRQPTAYLSAQIAQPLTRLPRLGLAVAQAGVARAVEDERVRAEQLAAVAAVKRLYFAVLQTDSAVAALDEELALLHALDRTVQTRVAQKVALRGDALDLQVRLARTELARTRRLNTRASQLEQLNRLIGRPVDAPLELTDAPDLSLAAVDPALARDTALAGRPDVREARLRLEHAELDRRIARADRLPDVQLALSYTSNVNVDLLPRNLATIGVRMSWEPWDWGRRTRTQAVKGLAVAQARLAVRDAEDGAAIEVGQRLRVLAEARAALHVADLAQTAARESLRVVTQQFHVQAALLPDVLQRRAALAAAVDDYLQARLAYWTARADFDQAVGEDVIP